MKTNGSISRGQVEQANFDPINRKRGVTKPFGLMFGAEAAEMVVGTDTFRATPGEGHLIPLVIDDEPVIAFERSVDDELLVHLTLRDAYNQPVLHVDRNVMQIVPGMWDITFEGQALTLGSGPGNIFLRIRFDPPSRVVIDSARIMSNGVLVRIQPSGITVNGSAASFAGNRWSGGLGLTFGHCPRFYNPINLLRIEVNRYEWAQDGGQLPE